MAGTPNPWPGGVGDGLVVGTYIKIFAVFLVLGIAVTIFDCDGPTDSQEQQSATATPAKSAPVVGLSSVTPTEQSAAITGLASVTPENKSLVETENNSPSTVTAVESTSANDSAETPVVPESTSAKEPDGQGDSKPLSLTGKLVRLQIRTDHSFGTFLSGGSTSELAFVSRTQSNDIRLDTRNEHGDLLSTRELPRVNFDEFLVVEGAVIYTDQGMYDLDGELLSNLDFLQIPNNFSINGLFASQFGDIFYLVSGPDASPPAPKFSAHFSALPVYSVQGGGAGLHVTNSTLVDGNKNYSFAWRGDPIPGEIRQAETNFINVQHLNTTVLEIRADRSFVDSSPEITSYPDTWSIQAPYATAGKSIQDWVLANNAIWIATGSANDSGLPCLWYSKYEPSQLGEPRNIVFQSVENQGMCSQAYSATFVSTGFNTYLDNRKLTRLTNTGETLPAPLIEAYYCHYYYSLWTQKKLTCTTSTRTTMHIFSTEGSHVSSESLEFGLFIAVSPSGYFLAYDHLEDLLFLKHIDRPNREWSVRYGEFFSSGLSTHCPSYGCAFHLTVNEDLSIELQSSSSKFTYSPKIGEVFLTDNNEWSPPGSECTLEKFGLLNSEYQPRGCASDDVILVRRTVDGIHLLIERQEDGNLRLIVDLGTEILGIFQPAVGRSGDFLMKVPNENGSYHMEIWTIE